jgi:hypothetical protein
MALLSWKTVKIVATGGVIIYAVSAFAGPSSTANFTTQTLHGTGWGVGVLFGAAPEAGTGFHEGINASKVAVNP